MRAPGEPDREPAAARMAGEPVHGPAAWPASGRGPTDGDGAGEFERGPVVHVDLRTLNVSASPRSGGESSEHVALLAAQDDLPPILVHRPTMTVIDGLHRVKAARVRGDGTIAVRFFDGDHAEAFVLSVRLNVVHGLPLTLADRKRAAEKIMLMRPEWSNRRVASSTGISPTTVNDIRRRVLGENGGESRVGSDGRTRRIDGSLGRKIAGELLIQDPGLSLRQVARLAAISPETVRDVRNRLRRGESLHPLGRNGNASAGGDTYPGGNPNEGGARPGGNGRPGGGGQPGGNGYPAGGGQPGDGQPGGGGYPGSNGRRGRGAYPGGNGNPGRQATAEGRPVPGQRDVRSAEAAVRRALRAVPPMEPNRPRPHADRAVVLNGLKSDPALRFTDAGRNLLRLLSLHLTWTEQWESILDNVPPHCSELVSDLAREFAGQWAELAERTRDCLAEAG